ncbi:FAD-dependent monooxygenase [Komagataeibacter medellinensis]|uniref:Monooxygenase FAD-binding n=1 Tax=Komagataeibacter medellinensis (strain NBRC 3288 / BCRC 11682 / LMG 1693 / Kondo 51) TaxID=634177 RepID=G2I1G2_KOMMN|nr:FAD-dependent monooxygenase [Komagataeibacter medellinensis]BAK84770.1 monooxygenase FAD-binding [Komagataeibacter medellinensis NBRC 3288]
MSRPVLVTGVGPVRLIMAAELARYGPCVRMIDRLPTCTTQSCVLAIWSRTLELLDASGYADAFIATGLRVSAVRLYAGNRTLARVPFGAIAFSFNYLLMLLQSQTE